MRKQRQNPSCDKKRRFSEKEKVGFVISFESVEDQMSDMPPIRSIIDESVIEEENYLNTHATSVPKQVFSTTRTKLLL